MNAKEIAKYPTGPMIGIPGIPDDLTVSANPVSAWSLCDTAAARGSGQPPMVTAIAGEIYGGGRAQPIRPTQAVLVTHGTSTYLVWNGQRTQIDPADRSVTFNLGLDPGVTRPIQISNALFDAMPATEPPLVVPVIPEAGSPSRLLAGSVVGSVLETKDSGGNVSGFYALLPDGVQKITGFVADLLRTANSQGSTTPQLISPDKLVDIPPGVGAQRRFLSHRQAGFHRHRRQPP